MTDSDPKMQAESSTSPSPAPLAQRRLWAEWPTCPGCGKHRMTSCPACGEASEQFRLATAESQGAEPPPASLPILDLSEDDRYPHLVCPTCDDHFRPQFYQQCAWCGHEFEDGKQVVVKLAEQEMSHREWWTVWGLIGLAVGTLVWFAFVLSK